MSQTEADKSPKREDNTCTLNQEDNATLHDFVQEPVSDGLILPAELNTFLLHRIRDLKSENGHLRQEMEEAKETLQELRKSCPPEKLIALEDSNKAATTEIVELSKTCRHQAAELEVLKETCKKLEDELASKEIELENERLVNSKPEVEPIKFRDSTTMTEEEMTRYRQQTTELEILKENCKKLEEDLASKEVELENERLVNSKQKVEPVSFNDSATMTEEEASTLKNQLSEKDDRVRILTEKLQQANSKLYEFMNTCTSLRLEINKAQKLLCREVGESVTIASLSNRSSGWRGRAEQVQHLQQKVADLQSKLNEHDRSTSKASSSCSAFAVLYEQRNIGYLRNLEKERRQHIENSARELRKAELALEDHQRKLQAARARIKVLENETSNLKTNLTLLNEKRIHDDQLVEALNGQLRAVEDRYREREHEARYQKEKAEETCREQREELNAVRMQVELLRTRLQERETEIDNLRNDTARNKPSQPPKVFQPYSPGESLPETTRSFKEPNEYVTMSIAAEAERQRLLELVTVLNRRLDKERTDTDQISELLRRERNKNARIETKLQKLELEQVGMAKVNTGYRAKCSKSNVTSKDNSNSEKIQFKLELLEEECLALKTRLATVQQDKAADLEIYKKMLEQARRTFQNAFRGNTSYTAGCHSNVTI